MEHRGARTTATNGETGDASLSAERPGSLGILSASKAGVALVTLMALNLLNYVDRYLLAGAQPVMQKVSHANDAALGGLSSWFFIAYMISAPLAGWIGDRVPRRILVPAAVLWWSCAVGAVTLGSGFSWFKYANILMGVGEAAFGVFAVAMVSDYYAGANRSRALSLFLLSMNGGRALGVPIGGLLAESFGWQAPFRVMACVGLLLGAVGLRLLYEPRSAEELKRDRSHAGSARLLAATAMLGRAYICAVLGLAMENFVLGGLAVWLPTYLYRYAGYSVGHASSLLGAVTLACGIGGTWAGGAVGARLIRRNGRGLYWMSAACFVLVVPCILALLTSSHWLMVLGVTGSLLFLYVNLAPLNTAILNSVPAAVRSLSVAVALFAIHALGDAVSPRLIGVVSDAHGLRAGLSITMVAAVAAAGLLLLGTRSHADSGTASSQPS